MDLNTNITLTINQIKLLNLLAIATKNASFVSLKGMITKHEIQNVVINVGCDYQRMLEHDIKLLENLNVESLYTNDIEIDQHFETARHELLKNKTKPNNYKTGQTDAYYNIQKNVKIHKDSGQLYIYGQKISKKTLEIHTPYKLTKKRAKTKAKDIIRTLLKTPNYRLYKFDNMESVNIKSQEIFFK